MVRPHRKHATTPLFIRRRHSPLQTQQVEFKAPVKCQCVCVIGRNLVTISCLFIFSTHKRFVVAFLRIYVWRRGLLAICCCWGVSVSWHFRDFHHIYMDVVCGDHGRRHNLLSLTDNAQRSVDDVFKWRSRFNALLIGDTINFLLYHIQRVFVCVHLFLCIVLVA